MMTLTEINPGSRVRHAEYGDGTVEFVVLNPINGDGSPSDRPYASVLFDDFESQLLPSIGELTVIGGVTLPNVPGFATLNGYAPAMPMSRHGIRPVALYHFRIDGQGPFIVTADADGSVYMPCNRCKGWGEYSDNQYDGSMCYGCYGNGLGKVTTWADAQRVAKRRSADAARKAAAFFAERWNEAHAWDAFRDANRDVVAFLADKRERSGFIGDMARKAADATPLSVRMVEALGKIMGQVAERTATRVAAGHVGTVGKRETFEVRVVSTRNIETDYGYSTLVIMETRDGASLKTFGSGEWARTVTADPEVWLSIKATVKAHDEYRGEPQTMLTRVAAA